jgi:stage V sporulation protein B
MLLSQSVTWGLSLVLLVLAPRWLGDVDFGKAFVATTFVGFFELLANLGTATYVTKEVARNTSLASSLVLNLMAAKAVWAVLLGAVSVGVAMLLGYDSTLVVLVAWCAVSMVFTTLQGSVASGLNGLQRMGGLAVASVVQKVVATIFIVLVLSAGWGVVWATAITSVAMLIYLVITWQAFREFVERPFSIEPRIIRRALVGGLPFFFASAIVLVYGKIDVPLLEQMSDSRTVGWYSVAYQWVSLPAFFAFTIMAAVFPSMSAHGKDMGPALALQTNKAIRLVFLVGAPVATGIGLVAKDGLRLIYSNNGFEHAAPLLAILAPHLPIVSITVVLGGAIAASDRQNAWLVVGVVAVIVNIGLNLAAIPWTVHRYHNGAIGAATVTVVTEMAILIGAMTLRPPGVFDRSTVSFLLRCGVASLAMIPPVIYLCHSIVTKVAVGVSVFAVCAFALGVLTPRTIWRAIEQVRGSVARTS